MPRRQDERILLTFLAIVLGATWPLQLPAILARRGVIRGSPGYFALVVVGYFVPTIAALVLSRGDLGGAGVRALLRPFCAYRVAPGW